MTNNRKNFYDDNYRNYDKDFSESYNAMNDSFLDDNQGYVDIYSDSIDRRTNDVMSEYETGKGYDNRRVYRRRPDKEPKGSATGVIISSIAFALVAVVAAGALTIGALKLKPVSNNTDPTVSIAASVEKDANKAAPNKTQPSQQIAAKAESSTSAQQTPQAQQAQQTQKSQDKIETINGERVYIDTKRQAPDKTGTPAHYYANGKTSYGFDWTYSADNNNFVIRCDYNFNQQQYDFQFYGTAPGTAHLTVYYNTDDNTKVPVNLTLNVDNSLNATLA